MFTGHAADRWDRPRILMVCYTVLLASAGVFLAPVVLLHRAGVAPMLGILVVFGASRAFENPAGQSLLPNLGPRDVYPGALAWNASAQHIATVGGPALGGLLFRRGPRGRVCGCWRFLRDGGCARVRDSAGRTRPRTDRGELGELARGPGVHPPPVRRVGAISPDLFAVLLGGTTVLPLAYARDIVRIGAVGLGVLRSAPAAVALAAAIVLAGRPLRGRVGRNYVHRRRGIRLRHDRAPAGQAGTPRSSSTAGPLGVAVSRASPRRPPRSDGRAVVSRGTEEWRRASWNPVVPMLRPRPPASTAAIIRRDEPHPRARAGDGSPPCGGAAADGRRLRHRDVGAADDAR